MAVKENIIKVTKALSKFHSNDTGDYDKTPLFDKIFKRSIPLINKATEIIKKKINSEKYDLNIEEKDKD